MNEIIKMVRPDYCPICKENYVVKCYDKFDNPINVSLAFDRKLFNIISNTSITTMKCSKCNKSFIPNWCMKDYPIALEDDTELKIFKSNFTKKGI